MLNSEVCCRQKLASAACAWLTVFVLINDAKARESNPDGGVANLPCPGRPTCNIIAEFICCTNRWIAMAEVQKTVDEVDVGVQAARGVRSTTPVVVFMTAIDAQLLYLITDVLIIHDDGKRFETVGILRFKKGGGVVCRVAEAFNFGNDGFFERARNRRFCRI
uniref:OJ1485_B09.10 protein n=2 Tax=Oryza sativa subsp. japonica TaxID=39947 RepID=Q8RZI6_ORYSJ|nr:OJ1485_B09.10 [Oryza sativa Japonica Group]BAD88374.1 hypothetical protein [Oryza sativa Japonica Group]